MLYRKYFCSQCTTFSHLYRKKNVARPVLSQQNSQRSFHNNIKYLTMANLSTSTRHNHFQSRPFFSFFNPKPSSLDYAFCTANSSQMAKGKILHCFQMISRSSSLRHFCKVHKEQKFPFLGKMMRTKVLFVCQTMQAIYARTRLLIWQQRAQKLTWTLKHDCSFSVTSDRAGVIIH